MVNKFEAYLKLIFVCRKHLFIVLSSLNAFKSSFKRGVVLSRAVATLQSVENQPLAQGN